MMKNSVKHAMFAQNVNHEQPEAVHEFMRRMSIEVQKLIQGGADIHDVIFSFPNTDINDEDQVTATIYFSSSDNTGYDMDMSTLHSKPSSSSLKALSDITTNVLQWSASHEAIEVYDMKIDLLIDKNGDDVASANVYSASKES